VILNSTITANTAKYVGGIRNRSSVANSITIQNTIVSNNLSEYVKTSGLKATDCRGYLYSNGNNIVGNPTGDPDNPVLLCTFSSKTTDKTRIDPKLGPLTGAAPILYRPLLAGSLAIDSGTNANCPVLDDRGVPRPQGLACDIGAYEYFAVGATNNRTFLPLLKH